VLGEGRTLLGDPDLEAELLHTARLCFAVRPGHPLLAHAPVTTEMLTRYPMGSATLTPALAYAFEEATGHASGENPSHLVVRTDRHDVLRALAMHTDLVLGGTTRVLRDDLATGALVDLAVHGIDFDYRLALASLAGRTLPAAATRLRDVARSQFT
jgi:DNA-binding transcriptional LysR family regulator